MRFETIGELRRVDLESVVELLPELRDEWSRLRFDQDGRLINPLSEDTVAWLVLVDGRHRQGGASYRITVSSPKLELPEERRAEFEKESRKLTRRNAKQEQWSEHFARRSDASVQVGVEHEHFIASLREDNARKLSFTLSNDDELWAVEVSVEHGRLPKVELDGRVNLTAAFRADGTPGCLAAVIGGTGRGSAMLDFGPLERGGRVVEAAGRVNRFRGDARVDVETSATKWMVGGDGALRARGLGRIVLLLAGRRIRRSIERSLTEFWASSEAHVVAAEKEISRLRRAIDEEGGPAPFIHRALWDEDFDPGLETLGGRRGGA